MSEDFGSYLKHERELRGISLEDVAQTTKISIRFLRALEDNRYDDLPGEVFVRGFIRSYGKVIGSNADELLAAYHESSGKQKSEESPEAPSAPSKPARELSRPSPPFPMNAVIGFSIALLVIIGGVFWATSGKSPPTDPGFQSTELSVPAEADPGTQEAAAEPESQPGEEPSIPPSESQASDSASASPEAGEPPASETEVPAKEGAAGKPESPPTHKNTVTVAEKDAIMKDLQDQSVPKSEEGSEQSTPEDQVLTLVIRVSENSWFNLTVDKQRDQDFILPSGGSKTIHANISIVMTIGNRRATQLTLNDQPLELPESPDNVIRNFSVNAERLN